MENEPCTLNLKARVLDCTYVVSDNDLVRVKGAIVLVDVHPFVEWCESHYGVKVRNKSKQVALRRGKLALGGRDVPRADYKWDLEDLCQRSHFVLEIAVVATVLFWKGPELAFYQKMMARKW